MPQPPLDDETCQRAIDAVAEHKTVTIAATVLGIPRSTFDGQYKAGLMRGLKPSHGLVEHVGFTARGVSTLYGPDGQVGRVTVTPEMLEAA